MPSPIDPARWQLIEEICGAALELPPNARGAFVHDRSGGDPDLELEVLDLINQFDDDPAFLARPIVSLPADPDGDRAELPDMIGAYRVVRRLGQGGMGEVYLATRDDEVAQTVAVKIIRPGMASDDVLRRFRLERRILASLHHPNIAPLYDAGITADGRPFFVMEYVEGQPITSYCDERRLSIRDRLELFVAICAAVQHAHQNLVVHRDLKPRNILVDKAGVPKLLDFGIGKVLSDSDALGPAVDTRTDLRLLTPDYAAPEQIAGRPVTTATDVYGLGILLYEQLTGAHPYVAGGESLAQIEQAVLQAVPTRPSVAVTGRPEQSGARSSDPRRLRRRLAGDLDTIVLKALRKEPERRYASAADLAADIQRHLDGLPVAARPDTLRYRAAKFVRRHAGAVVAAAAIFAAMAATTGVTLVQSRRVAAESARVAKERDKAVEVRGFLMEMFGATSAGQAVGDTLTVGRMLDRQAARLDELYEDRPEVKADMLDVLADGYDRLGQYDAAEPLARQALDLRRELFGPDHPDVAASLNALGWILHERGQSKDGEPLLRDAVRIRRAAGPTAALDLARSLNDLGVVLSASGEQAEAETVLDEALALRQALAGSGHRSVGITANNLASVYYRQAKYEDAVRTQMIAVEALAAAVGTDHQRTVIALSNLAVFRRILGDLDGAEATLRDLVERQTRIQGRNHPITATTITTLAATMSDDVREPTDSTLAEAELLLREAVVTLETALGPTHRQLGTALLRLATVQMARRDREALDTQRRAVSILRGAYGARHPITGEAVRQLGIIHWRLGDPAAAEPLLRQAALDIAAAVGDSHPRTAMANLRLCGLLLFRGGRADAVEICAAAEGGIQKAPAVLRRNLPFSQLRLTQAHLEAGNRQVADSILSEVRATLGSAEGSQVVRRLIDSLTSVLSGQ